MVLGQCAQKENEARDRNDILQIHVENMQKGLDEMKMVLRNL